MNRRKFLYNAAWGTTAAVGRIIVTASIVEVLPPETESYSLIKIGSVTDFPLNEFSFIAEKKLYLLRTRRCLRVLSAVCTHLGCTVQKSEQGFRCPCHGSAFDKSGKACSGPASRPLDRLLVTVDKSGLITVNLKRTMDKDYILS